MSPTLETVWIVPVNVHQLQAGPSTDEVPQKLLLAYSPAYQIGAMHAGLGAVTWFSTDRQGHPQAVIEKPTTGPVDLILFRLSQAHVAGIIASCPLPTNPAAWKA